jgi:hypothetical protein
MMREERARCPNGNVIFNFPSWRDLSRPSRYFLRYASKPWMPGTVLA